MLKQFKTDSHSCKIEEKFVNGELHFTDKNRLTIIRGWPEISAKTKSPNNSTWENSIPKLNLNRYEGSERQLSFSFLPMELEDNRENKEAFNKRTTTYVLPRL